MGGFSLVCGRVGQPLAVVSNRTPTVEGTTWIMGERNETVGLSNAAFADRTWTKVTRGEEMLKALVAEEDAKLSHDRTSVGDFVEKLFALLSNDTLPRKATEEHGLAACIKELRNSIFIPVVGGEATHGARADKVATAFGEQMLRDAKLGNDGSNAPYGTQKQSVVLVSHQGHVSFVERSLYDGDARQIERESRDRWFEFDIEGWKT